MSRTMIEVSQLSKRYRLGTSELGYSTLRDAIARAFRRGESKPEERELWALRGVDLEVEEGEALGIIGPNGAGKSTLLKILSRITPPTEGWARLHGRVASLLEVGIGFHPELTGRENVYLKGVILGLRRAEIRRQFDEIVAFAGVERFLDTPVKRYSSGMYVRLAFAVAAYLSSEILIVDEVLAVGDAEFQRRCLGRMREAARGGRTVLFVSHNLSAIEQLCARAVLVRKGRIETTGTTAQVIAAYLSAGGGEGPVWDLTEADREGTGTARITRLELRDLEGSRLIDRVRFLDGFRLRIHYRTNVPIRNPEFGLRLLSELEEPIFMTNNVEVDRRIAAVEGDGWIDCVIPAPNLLPGAYVLDLWIIDVRGKTYADRLRRIGGLRVVLGDWNEHSVAQLHYSSRGHVYARCDWQLAQDGP